jgi:thiol-disulfide isomerase/thioredoxin
MKLKFMKESDRNKLFRLATFLIIFLITVSSPQKSSSQSLPEFTVQLTNGKLFTKKDISHKEPFILIYFAPDCGHCQALIREVLKRINEFKKSQILLVSFESLQDVTRFEKDYGLKSHPSIKTGIEKQVFLFRYYYHLENTPFTALYDKQGKYVISYKTQTPVDDLIKHLNALK